MFYRRIPNNKKLEPYIINNYIDEELVEVTDEYGIVVEMQYPLKKMKNATSKCLVRKQVLERLLQAKKYLPKGITFKIWDTYRPMNLQQEIYDKYKNIIIQTFHLENKTNDQQQSIIANYVSLPTYREDLIPLHTTGGSIDLTLVYEDTKQELDMGVEFDEFSTLTKTSAFEEKGMDKKIRNNRRILYWSMIKAGFTNLPSEVWHYDYGNRAWAFYNQKETIYNIIK